MADFFDMFYTPYNDGRDPAAQDELLMQNLLPDYTPTYTEPEPVSAPLYTPEAPVSSGNSLMDQREAYIQAAKDYERQVREGVTRDYEDSRAPRETSSSDALASAIIAAAPTLAGGLFGGAQGFGYGAQIGGQASGNYLQSTIDERKRQDEFLKQRQSLGQQLLRSAHEDTQDLVEKKLGAEAQDALQGRREGQAQQNREAAMERTKLIAGSGDARQTRNIEAGKELIGLRARTDREESDRKDLKTRIEGLAGLPKEVDVLDASLPVNLDAKEERAVRNLYTEFNRLNGSIGRLSKSLEKTKGKLVESGDYRQEQDQELSNIISIEKKINEWGAALTLGENKIQLSSIIGGKVDTPLELFNVLRNNGVGPGLKALNRFKDMTIERYNTSLNSYNLGPTRGERKIDKLVSDYQTRYSPPSAERVDEKIGESSDVKQAAVALVNMAAPGASDADKKTIVNNLNTHEDLKDFADQNKIDYNYKEDAPPLTYNQKIQQRLEQRGFKRYAP